MVEKESDTTWTRKYAMAYKVEIAPNWVEKIKHSNQVIYNADKMVSKYTSIFHSPGFVVPTYELLMKSTKIQNDEPLDNSFIQRVA